MSENEALRAKILRAQAMLDDELDAEHARTFERDLETDPELAAVYRRLSRLGASVRDAAPRESAPEALRTRILAMAEAAPPRRRASPPLAWAAALAGAGIALGGLALALRLASPDDDARLHALVAGYMRAQVSGQPFDVASSDRHTVKPWLAARVTLGAAVIDLADQGFPLAGGRVDIVDDRPTPTLVYRRREHVISVSELPLASAGGTGALAMEGFRLERWRDGERAYVAISDIDAADLAAFAQAFRRAQAQP